MYGIHTKVYKVLLQHAGLLMFDFLFQSGANGVFGVSAVRVVVKVSDIEGESVSRVTTALVAPRRRRLATSTSLVVRMVNSKLCMVHKYVTRA